ncbi:MAG: ChuX/HutX family heme-like substrate-binding protein [Pseudomonadota bacterium]
MSDPVVVSPPAAQSQLLSAFKAAKAKNPKLRTRDLAAVLEVSEAEIVAAGCLGTATPLRPDWAALVKALPKLGQVMTLVRNEACVHEKVGTYTKVSTFASMGLVLDPDIDLRLFFDRWHYAYALREEMDQGPRFSLQIFDCDGTAVQKIFLRADSDSAAFLLLVADFATPAIGPPQLLPAPALPVERPDADIDQAALRQRWEDLQDVHDFHAMLKTLGCARRQAFRLVGTDFARPLSNDRFQAALEAAGESALPVMVFVGSPGVIQIHSGPVKRLQRMGPWFNVLDPGFNLHLREDLIDQTWLVIKPTRDGIVTSIEIFDATGLQIAWIFGLRKPGQAENPAWQDLVARLEAKS